MGRQTRSKRPDKGASKGKVTPIQVAFIVDRYLSDNNFSKTRSIFRSEASSLISKSAVQEAPKSLLSLEAMLNEYISLKEEKVILNQEKARLDHEKSRVQKLLHGMQDVMNTYNESTPPTPAIQASTSKPTKPTEPTAIISLPNPSSGTPPGYAAQNGPTITPMSMPSNKTVLHDYSSPAVTNCPVTRKRTGSNAVVEAPRAAKKSRNKFPSQRLQNNAAQEKVAVTCQDAAQKTSVIESSPYNCAPNGTSVQGSSVVKNLFNQPAVPIATNSPSPKTPPQPISPQSDKSPLGENSAAAACSANSTPQGITPTSCTMVSSERVIVSPCKQVVYMERNRCISSCSPVKTNIKRPNMRDHVKGRLDFGGSDVGVNSDNQITNEISTSESEKDIDIFDLDFPSLDAFGPNFSFSELLVDLDIDCEGIGYPCQPPLDASMDNVSGSSDSGNSNMGADQVMSQYSSTVTEVVSGKNMNVLGPDTQTSVKSVTKSIRILSPVKSCRSSLAVENCSLQH